MVSVVFGNSCDSMDKLPGQFALPATPQEGDWLVVRSFGGYGGTFYTGFNGLPKQQFLVVQKGALVPWESIPHVTPEPAY